mmetsp:Transcript_112882/g.319750  ORF Transcript_112882/g.319750 Transcript_112882/m.319750 type:complete len:232 (-) Transcript_112882:263-958(-)
MPRRCPSFTDVQRWKGLLASSFRQCRMWTPRSCLSNVLPMSAGASSPSEDTVLGVSLPPWSRRRSAAPCWTPSVSGLRVLCFCLPPLTSFSSRAPLSADAAAFACALLVEAPADRMQTRRAAPGASGASWTMSLSLSTEVGDARLSADLARSVSNHSIADASLHTSLFIACLKSADLLLGCALFSGEVERIGDVFGGGVWGITWKLPGGGGGPGWRSGCSAWAVLVGSSGG